MKYILLLILAYPFVLFGRNATIDTTCICGNQVPSMRKDKAIVVEEMATYPGGKEFLKRFIKSNVRLDSNESGKIQVSFVINCKGSTCGFNILDKEGSISTNSETKIIEALKKMDRWTPAKQRDKPVDVPFKIQITINKGIPE